MPRIYLSPSTQEKNQYVNGGTEEEWMNRLADAMEPYLQANNIQYTRNTPQMTAGSSIRQSNAGQYDLHLALHSNAAPEKDYGKYRGVDVYYDPRSSRGRRAAELIAQELKAIYPLPDRVRARTTTSLGEVTKTKAPAVLVEYAYHDNPEDAQWIKDNLDAMARQTVVALTRYFGLPYARPLPAGTMGQVDIESGVLNIRQKPNTQSPVVARAPRGAMLRLLGQWQDWYMVEYQGSTGYARADFIDRLG